MQTATLYCEDCDEDVTAYGFYTDDEDGFMDFVAESIDGHQDHDLSLPR